MSRFGKRFAPWIRWVWLIALGTGFFLPAVTYAEETPLIEVVALGKGEPAPFEGVLYSTEAARIEDTLVTSATAEAALWRGEYAGAQAQAQAAFEDFRAYIKARDQRDAEMAIYYKKEMQKAQLGGFWKGLGVGAILILLL